MDIYTSLKNDHEELKDLLIELFSLIPGDTYSSVLISEIEKVLVPHFRAEESVFYNSIRGLSFDYPEVVHNFKEHLEIETLLRTLKLKEGVGFNWKAEAIKFQEALEHHILKEDKIFIKARKLFREDEAQKMGNAFVEMKEKFTKDSFLKNTFVMVINLMPPRFFERIRNIV